MKSGTSETVATSSIRKGDCPEYTVQQRDQGDGKAIKSERMPSRVKKTNKKCRLLIHGGQKCHRCSYRVCPHGDLWG